MCDANGLWQGEWPQCIPKQTCSKEEITKDHDPSITVERVANVYYLNETDWYAIEHSSVRYACVHPDGILVGKSERTCVSGQWTNRIPHCTQGEVGTDQDPALTNLF